MEDLKNAHINSSGFIRWGGQAWNPPWILTRDTWAVLAQSVHFFSSMPQAMGFSSIWSRLQSFHWSHESTVLGRPWKRPPYQGNKGSSVPWILKIEMGCWGWQSETWSKTLEKVRPKKHRKITRKIQRSRNCCNSRDFSTKFTSHSMAHDRPRRKSQKEHMITLVA